MKTTKITSTEKEITSDSARTSITFHGTVTIHVGSPWRSHHIRRDTRQSDARMGSSPSFEQSPKSLNPSRSHPKAHSLTGIPIQTTPNTPANLIFKLESFTTFGSSHRMLKPVPAIALAR